ncbi:MAG: carboxypeptidase regulatory-like domain-containing protein [Bryobacteraceae bacterium]
MKHSYSKCVRSLALLFAVLLAASGASAQSQFVTLRGRVTDPSALFVPEAVVTVTGNGVTLRQTTDVQGQYTFANLKPGAYTIRITKPGFAIFEVGDYDVSSSKILDAQMIVSMEAQKVTVKEDAGGVSVDPNNNAGALVLKGTDLDALSDDPDQLSDDLQALAGPSAGPNGGQIFIDGFSGGQLPPKASIREIRINQNPFSAEYDRLGFGRIEIFTKPGTDKFRGQFMMMAGDNVFNARNPFVAEKSPYESKMFMGNISGPVTKKTSFNFDIEHRGVDENAVVNATVLDSNFLATPFSQAIVTPQSRWHIVPRFDVQLNDKNTLTFRYGYSRTDNQNMGIGQFSLASRAYDSLNSDHTFQVTETAVLSPHAINETRFQFIRSNVNQNADNSIPTIQVLDAFTGGGSQIGHAYDNQDRYEISNNTSFNSGTHAWKFGGRVRVVKVTDQSPNNFGGTYTFSGGLAPQLDAGNNVVTDGSGNPVMVSIDSIERYRRTQYFQSLGLTNTQIRNLGGGASQFGLAGGNPLANINQTDLGVFALDDWRWKPNVTVSYGVRYETQTNIHDWKDFSPRVAVAWGVDGGKNKSAKTVLRTGFGIFYDRIDDTLSLSALRFNGVTQQQYLVPNPDFYPTIPSVADLSANLVPQTIREKANDLRAPYILQTALSLDRQLPRNTALSVTYTFSRGANMLRARNINAPLADGSLPYGATGNLYLYESTGLMRQNQIITNLNTRFSKRISLFGFYMLNFAKGDSDGSSSFPASSYDLHNEWGSTMFDVRHRVFMGGSVSAPFKVTFNPFVTASSGVPFNITTGVDGNGDSIFNDRPAFATDPSAEGTKVTQWGAFNPNPKPGDTIIPRNYGRGPGQFSVNMRVSRTWGFGEKSGSSGNQNQMGPMGGPGGGGGRGGPMMMGGGGGRGGPGGMFGAANTGKRFNLTLSASARNLFNRVNLATPNGNLSSALFGESLSLASGMGPGGASAASNRRLDFQLRFSF